MGTYYLEIEIICPQNGTAVLTGPTPCHCTVGRAPFFPRAPNTRLSFRFSSSLFSSHLLSSPLLFSLAPNRRKSDPGLRSRLGSSALPTTVRALLAFLSRQDFSPFFPPRLASKSRPLCRTLYTSDRSRSTVNNPGPNSPLRDVVQDLYSTDPTQNNMP